jgi:phosphopentomutase
MTSECRAKLETEIVTLKAKASARRDQPGFAANVAAIDARIADIEAELASPDP